MTDVTTAKWVRIMCDYSADPVWASDGTMIDLDDLPVTQELKQRLRAWEEIFDRQDLFASSPSYDVAAFSRTGRELAREVKRQLPDWTVVYYDEEAAAAKAADAPTETFEYEIEI